DIGGVSLSGFAGYNATSTLFDLQSAGSGMSGIADAFHFVYQPINGDAMIVARLANIQSVTGGTQAGVLIRESLDPGSAAVFMQISGATSPQFEYRQAAGVNAVGISGSPLTVPSWFKLIRIGNSFSGYVSND